MKTLVIETETGARILPANGDPMATVTEWAAFCTMSADLRTTSPAYAELASKLHIQVSRE